MLGSFDVLVVGELCVDLILSDKNPVPRFGQRETLVSDGQLELGSASAILACQAARLGLRTAFAGKVGRDLFGQFVLDTLGQRGVDVRGVDVDPAWKTGITVHLSSPTDRAMLTYPGAMAAFAAGEVPAALLVSSRHLHVSSFFLQPELQKGLVALVQAARSQGMSVSLDPGWDPAEAWDGALHELLPLVDLFFPNEQEICRIARRPDLTQAIEVVGKQVPVVAVKLGPRGAIAHAGGSLYNQPAYPVKPLDTTGAGDSFDAGFLFGFLGGKATSECLRYGCICGALSTAALGGIASQPTLAALLEALEAWPTPSQASIEAHS